MDTAIFISAGALLLAFIWLVTVGHLSPRFRRRRALERVAMGLDEPIRLHPPRHELDIPWRSDPKSAEAVARYGLEVGRDEFGYDQAEDDNHSQKLIPAQYNRHSITWRTPPPTLAQLAVKSSPGFIALMKDLDRLNDFPAPEGQGVATVREQLPPGEKEKDRIQDLIDYVYARAMGEEVAMAHFIRVASLMNERAGRAAARLLKYLPDLAKAADIHRSYARFYSMPELAVDAAHLCLPDTRPLEHLALEARIPDETAMRAWQLLEVAAGDELYQRGLQARTAGVFEAALSHAIKSGPVDQAVLIRHVTDCRSEKRPTGEEDGQLNSGNVGHAIALARALAKLPPSDADRTLAVWLTSQNSELRRATATTLAEWKSTAGSEALVGLLQSAQTLGVGGVEENFEFALTWLPTLGAAAAVGKIREFGEARSARAPFDPNASAYARRANTAIELILSRHNVSAGNISLFDEAGGELALADGDGAMSFASDEPPEMEPTPELEPTDEA